MDGNFRLRRGIRYTKTILGVWAPVIVTTFRSIVWRQCESRVQRQVSKIPVTQSFSTLLSF
jgi:hypothetical protein